MNAIAGRTLHRLAVLLVCLVWPLIWIGGLVTTYDAGMAVPDWPGTYGYNMFLYPLETWLLGPFDLLIEHGHRLLGAVVGFVAILALIAAFWSEPRRWVTGLSAIVLVAVIVQGVLGGMRVVLDQRTLAMIHGCFGPAFFGLCTALAVVTSRWWWTHGSGLQGETKGKTTKLTPPSSASARIGRWTLRGSMLLAALCYGQLLLGAQLRHLQPGTSPTGFRHLVETHVATALAVWILTALLAVRLWRCGDLALSRPARWLVGLVAIQIALGLGTWVVNYGVPVSTEQWPGGIGFSIQQYVILSKGYVESGIVTAHVATGSLLIACSVLLCLRCWRVFRARRSAADQLGSELQHPTESDRGPSDVSRRPGRRSAEGEPGIPPDSSGIPAVN